MVELYQSNELSIEELTNLKLFVNTIVTNITDGNSIEKEMTGIMGGTAYETDVDRVTREVQEEFGEKMAEKDKALAEKDEALAEKDEALAEKDNELADLKKRNAELEAQLAAKS